MSIELHPEKLVFLTEASFQAGEASGSDFPVIEETQVYIKAVDNGTRGVAPLETFVLNKQSGIGIWTKVRPAGFMNNGIPDSQTLYYSCQ